MSLPVFAHLPTKAVLSLALVALCVAAFLIAFTDIFQANTFDSDTLRAGAIATLHGDNPYRDADGLSAYFNPPHSVYAYPLMLGPRAIYLLSLVLIVALAVYVFDNPWLALYVATPAFIVHGIGANNLGLQVGVLGVVALWLAQEREGWLGAALTAWGYGLLLIKPQVGLGMVVLHLLWLLWQGRARLFLMTAGVGVMWFLLLPTLIGLLAGNRLLWLDWWRDVVQNRLIHPVPDIRIDPNSDMEPFINKWGIPGAVALTLLSAAVWWEQQRD